MYDFIKKMYLLLITGRKDPLQYSFLFSVITPHSMIEIQFITLN